MTMTDYQKKILEMANVSFEDIDETDILTFEHFGIDADKRGSYYLYHANGHLKDIQIGKPIPISERLFKRPKIKPTIRTIQEDYNTVTGSTRVNDTSDMFEAEANDDIENTEEASTESLQDALEEVVPEKRKRGRKKKTDNEGALTKKKRTITLSDEERKRRADRMKAMWDKKKNKAQNDTSL